MGIYTKPLKRTWRLNSGERKIILFVGDVIASVLALMIALYFWAQSPQEWLNFSWQFLGERIPGWYYLLPVIWMLLLVELYDVDRSSNRLETLKGIAIAAIIAVILYLIVYFTSEPNSLPRRGVASFILGAFLLTLGWRMLYIAIFTAPRFMRRVIVVGAGRAGTTLLQVIKSTWPPPFFLVGLVDDDPEKIGAEFLDYRVLGSSADLMALIKEHHVSDLIFAISGEMRPETFRVLLEAEEHGVQVTTMPAVYEQLLGRVPIFLLQSDWILRSFLDQAHLSGFYEVGKRLIDLLGGFIGLLIFVIATPFIALLILLDNGRPIFYSQERVGLNGRVFTILKFRTMRSAPAKPGEKAVPTVENDARITRLGKILRKSHVDELPQFINILRGEMSLVGPRSEQPAIVQELQEQIPFYRARLLVKPGLTGWAQVNYGYASNAAQNAIKVEFDLYYIKRRNLLLDVLILFRTFGAVFGLRGQ